MADEKAIVIDAQVWKEKYIPMEQYNEKLIQELAELKASKKILVTCKIRSSWNNEYSIDIGHVGIEIDGTVNVNLDGNAVGNVADQVETYIRNSMYSPFTSRRLIYSDDVNMFLKDITTHALSIEESNRKKTLMVREYLEKVRNIPRWLRRWYGIKVKDL